MGLNLRFDVDEINVAVIYASVESGDASFSAPRRRRASEPADADYESDGRMWPAQRLCRAGGDAAGCSAVGGRLDSWMQGPMWTLSAKSSSRRTKRRGMSAAMQDEGAIGSLAKEEGEHDPSPHRVVGSGPALDGSSGSAERIVLSTSGPGGSQWTVRCGRMEQRPAHLATRMRLGAAAL